LPFQLGLEGVPLAEEETIDFLLGGFCARRSTEQVVYLAWGPLFWVVPLCFVFSHEKRLLSVCPAHPVSPVLRGRAQKKKATRRSVHTLMALTDTKRPQATAVVCKYLVYQALSGVSVSRSTLCLMTPLRALEDESMPAWDIGHRARRDGRGDSL
jgi:hypothetical protein